MEPTKSPMWELHHKNNEAEMRNGVKKDPMQLVVKVEEPASGPTKPPLYPGDGCGGGDGGDGGEGAGLVWRGSSYDFQNDLLKSTRSNQNENEDSSGEFDFGNNKVDEENEERDLENQQSLSPAPESPHDHGKITPRAATAKVSFKESEMIHRRPSDGGGEDEVVRCSSNASFQRRQIRSNSINKAKTKSRLLDPPEDFDRRSGRMMKSGLISLDDEDPFWDEDIPEEYKKMKFSVTSVIQWTSLLLIVAGLICSVVITPVRRVTVWDMQLWKWEVMVLVLICGGLVSNWLIRIVVFFIERNFLLRKRVLYFVYGLRRAVMRCLWLGWVLIAWSLILDKKIEKETSSRYLPYVTKFFVCLLVGTLIWLVKTLLVKVLAMSFHVSTFFDRIQEALFDQYVIETLSGPPTLEIERVREDEERVMSEVQKLQNAGLTIPADLRASCFPKTSTGKPLVGSGRSIPSEGLQKTSQGVGKSTAKSGVIGKSPRLSRAMSKKEEAEGGITIDHLHKLNQKNISAWNMKRLMNIVRNGVLSTLDEQILDSGIEDESSMLIRSEKQAKAAAKRIFSSVARPGSKCIVIEDLMRFMREDEATRTMRVIEGSVEKKGISKRALKDWVVNVFRERRALALSLNDTKTAVNKLHQLLNFVVGFAVAIIWLLILGVPIMHFLVFTTSQILLLTFMFGNTFKTTFEAIIFLFVMHPFDVGDRCEVDDVQMIVEEMNILTTVFLRYDNLKITYPNSVLATKPINNYYRSPEMGDSVDFCVHISTPVEKLAVMKERITRYIENKRDHWRPSPMVVMRDIEDLNRLKFSVWLSHTINHQNMGEKWARRALLLEEMVKIFKELDIEYRMLPWDVNVRSLPSLVSNRLPSNWITCARKL